MTLPFKKSFAPTKKAPPINIWPLKNKFFCLQPRKMSTTYLEALEFSSDLSYHTQTFVVQPDQMVVRSKAQQTEQEDEQRVSAVQSQVMLGMNTKITRPVCNSFKTCGIDPPGLRTYKANSFLNSNRQTNRQTYTITD